MPPIRTLTCLNLPIILVIRVLAVVQLVVLVMQCPIPILSVATLRLARLVVVSGAMRANVTVVFLVVKCRVIVPFTLCEVFAMSVIPFLNTPLTMTPSPNPPIPSDEPPL